MLSSLLSRSFQPSLAEDTSKVHCIKEPSKAWPVGEVVGSKLARVCRLVLVSFREGEARSAGSIDRSRSAQGTAAGQEYLDSEEAHGVGEGLSRVLGRGT